MSVIEQSVDEKLIEKWSDVIEGKGEWAEFISECPKVPKKLIPLMAQSLENVAGDLEESTNAAAIGSYSPILIPMLRRIIPSQIGPRILGTYAMSAPSQLIFGIRSVYQNTTANPVTYANSILLTLASATAFSAGTAISGSASGVGVCRYVEDNYVIVQVTSGTFAVGDDVDDAAIYAASVTTVAANNVNEATFNIILKDYDGPYSTAAGEALSTDMRELGFKIFTDTLVTQTHKLKAKWTEELEDDLRAIHNMNADAVLTQIATDEIDLEQNQTIIEKVATAATAGGTTAWDYDTADGRYEVEKYLNLMAAISRTKRAIATSTKRGQATWMIVSPAVLTAIETAGKLDASNVDPVVSTFVGRAMGMDVFCDIYATNNTIYLGYKGNNEMEAGIFYGVYKPIMVRKGFGEEDGNPRSIFRCRNGFIDNIYGSENYFRRITVANLP